MGNVLDKETGEPLCGMARSRIVTHQGRTIGILGLVEQEWLATLITINASDVDYVDFVEEGTRLARELRAQGAECVIALTHMREPNDCKLAAEVPEIDLILGGKADASSFSNHTKSTSSRVAH